jgi:predicted dehydrogenase
MNNGAAMKAGRPGLAVVGAGYWGKNLIRNAMSSQKCDFRLVCDVDVERAQTAVGRYNQVATTDDIDRLLDDKDINAVIIATPASTHAEVALACLEAGKHVMVEKPLAWSVAEGEKLVDKAASLGLVLMCDHTYCYTPAVQRIRELVRTGVLGDIHYVDSVRINLGLVQPDVDVFWDLAPHDLAILDVILPDGLHPTSVAAQGADPLGTGRPCVGYLTLPLSNGAIAHTHLNWLSPTKVRTMIIGGSERMLVWDDLNPVERLRLYDTGVRLGEDRDAGNGQEALQDKIISYRTGDILSPALSEREALQSVIGEFMDSINEGRAPLTDGRSGVRVLQLLDAASRSLGRGGVPVDLEGAPG